MSSLWALIVLTLLLDLVLIVSAAKTKKSTRGFALAYPYRHIPLWFSTPEGLPAASFLYPAFNLTTTAASATSSFFLDSHLLLYQAKALLPPDGRRSAVLVLPGGGYVSMALSSEGSQVARVLNKIGISAFVLVYRRPGRGRGAHYPLQDALRAMQIIRGCAALFNVHPQRICVIGFSVGGHVAAMLAVHHSRYASVPTLSHSEAEDAVDFRRNEELLTGPLKDVPTRPDFAVLAYSVVSTVMPLMLRAPGVSMGIDKRVRHNLFGVEGGGNLSKIPPETLAFFSAELHVRNTTPPCFIVHSRDDPYISVNNSILFHEACMRQKVSSELHVLYGHHHGYAMGGKYPRDELTLQEQLWYRLPLVSWLFAQRALFDRRLCPTQRLCDDCSSGGRPTFPSVKSCGAIQTPTSAKNTKKKHK